jgi:hypothetical protein
MKIDHLATLAAECNRHQIMVSSSWHKKATSVRLTVPNHGAVDSEMIGNKKTKKTNVSSTPGRPIFNQTTLKKLNNFPRFGTIVFQLQLFVFKC